MRVQDAPVPSLNTYTHMKIHILHASVNPDMYDVTRLGTMGFGEAREFFEDDKVKCCNWGIDVIDVTTLTGDASDALFIKKQYMPEGVMSGDTSDALFVWFKLVPWG